MKLHRLTPEARRSAIEKHRDHHVIVTVEPFRSGGMQVIYRGMLLGVASSLNGGASDPLILQRGLNARDLLAIPTALVASVKRGY